MEIIRSKAPGAVAVLLACTTLFASCTSYTRITSDPPGAKLYIDGQHVGSTPYTYSDTKIVFSSTSVQMEKEGYEPLNTVFTRSEEADVGAIIGGLFVWVPFLWMMKYKPVHHYELRPQQADAVSPARSGAAGGQGASQSERLREMKKLYDEGILTKEEYEKVKKRILEE